MEKDGKCIYNGGIIMGCDDEYCRVTTGSCGGKYCALYFPAGEAFIIIEEHRANTKKNLEGQEEGNQ